VNSLGSIITANLKPGMVYSNYDQQVYWQPPYDTQTPGQEANVVSVGKSRSPSPWLTYDQGGNAVEYTDTTTTVFPPNSHKLPVYFKVHGGVANATTYQLWLTATGTSDPYAQSFGQITTQGGGRFGFVPNARADQGIRSSRFVTASPISAPIVDATL
jgi:hypothetical protein